MYSENNVIKIALTGKLRSGKSEIAVHLWMRHGFEYPISFGSTLKYYAEKVFALTPKPDGKPRAMYQAFGQACRQYDPDVWVRHAAFKVDTVLEKRSTVGVVIEDLRQPNEYEWCRANGFIIVRVTAPDELRIARAKAAGDDFSAEDLAHETEQHIDGFAVDYEIHNDRTVEELLAKVDELVDEIKRKGAIE